MTEKPTFVPLHPAFVGKRQVTQLSDHLQKKLDGPKYTVDLSTGTCNCRLGGPWSWHDKRQEWVPAQYCSHKVRVMADILDKAGRPADMQIAYAKAVNSRYNVFETVSAFHKELRRGDIEKAVFWGTMLAASRKTSGVIKYMFNILYEETRDHRMGEYLMKCLVDNNTDYTTMCRAISWFCDSTKKWYLKRLPYLEAEMKGYARLVKDFGRDVAKGALIIPEKHRGKLLSEMIAGLNSGDLVRMQYGLKGLQKIQLPGISDKTSPDKINQALSEHRADLANRLLGASKSAANRDGVGRFVMFLSARGGAGLGIGYHELNAFADLLSGEPYSAGETPALIAKRRISADPPELRLGVVPTVPKYAHDNHTWAGKRMLKAYPEQWLPGADQKDFDLRLCGAYMGVNWRQLAVAQHGNITCAWGDVKWPKWQHEVVSNLWY